jgi:Ser/Thr protein kinase RdoA (MazF antagonist)
MEKILSEAYGLSVQEASSMSRKDAGNDNDLYKIIASEGEYFLKEIPGHSKREDTESIYSELSKCKLSKSRMVLPLKSNDGKYLVSINDKDMMLYPFVEHRVLNEMDIEIDQILEVLEDLFNGFSKINIPKHPFKTYNNWFERGVSQLRKKVSNHKFLDLFEDYINTRFLELDFKIGNTHFDLNPFNIWVDNNNDILLSDFDNVQIAAYAKDIFDACSKFVKVSSKGVELSESNLEMIFKFSKKYITNIEIRDVKYLLTRPKLGNLFDPRSGYSDEELKKKIDDFFEFCSPP